MEPEFETNEDFIDEIRKVFDELDHYRLSNIKQQNVDGCPPEFRKQLIDTNTGLIHAMNKIAIMFLDSNDGLGEARKKRYKVYLPRVNMEKINEGFKKYFKFKNLFCEESTTGIGIGYWFLISSFEAYLMRKGYNPNDETGTAYIRREHGQEAVDFIKMLIEVPEDIDKLTI